MRTSFLRVCVFIFVVCGLVARGDEVRVRVKNFSPGTLPNVISPNDRLWRTDAAGNSFGVGPNLDPSGHDESRQGIRVVKMDMAGQLVWQADYETNGQADALSTALDEQGNLYITGLMEDGLQRKGVLTLKYSAAGELLWTNLFYQGDMAIGRLIAVDSGGNAAVLYESGGQLFLLKVYFDGSRAWVRELGEVADLNPSPIAATGPGFCVVFDAWGNPVVSMSVPRSDTDADPVTLTRQWTGDGTLLWSNQFDNGVDAQAGVIPNAVATDKNGNVFVATFSSREDKPLSYVGKERVTIISFSPNGTPRWEESIERKKEDIFNAMGHGLLTDPTGAVYYSDARHRTRDGTNTVVALRTVKINWHGKRVWFDKREVKAIISGYFRFQSVTPHRARLYFDTRLDAAAGGSVPWFRTTVEYIGKH